MSSIPGHIIHKQQIVTCCVHQGIEDIYKHPFKFALSALKIHSSGYSAISSVNMFFIVKTVEKKRMLNKILI